MTIDEAIKQLEHAAAKSGSFNWLRDEQAIKLGIEALKRIRAHREHASHYTSVLLPGETE